MGTNKILPFAQGAGANVLTDDGWASSDVLAQGFQAGRAASIKYNKALRQSSVVASGLAQFVADYGQQDFSDSLSPQTIRDNFRAAVAASQAGAYYALDTSNAANTVTLVLSPAPVAALSSFLAFYFLPANTNTGAVTLTLNGNTASLLRQDGTTLQSGDIPAGRLARAFYHAASGKFRMVGSVASDSINIITQVQTNRIPFNEIVIPVSARVSMSVPANNAGVFATGVTGVPYTKQVAGSRLVVQHTCSCFSPIVVGAGNGAVTQRIRATSSAGPIGTSDTTVTTGFYVVNTSSPFAVGQAPIFPIDGLPAGPLTIDLLFKRDDNAAWSTIVNPTSADVPGYPSPNYGVFIIKEEYV